MNDDIEIRTGGADRTSNMKCIECGATENLVEVVVTTKEKGTDNVLDQESAIACMACVKPDIDELWGQPDTQVELEYTRGGEIHRVGWDGETTYVPVELPDDATDDDIAAVMAKAARSLGF